jgi:hypothetical protein
VPLLLASHEITSFGSVGVRALLSVGGAAAVLLFAPVLRAMYARTEPAGHKGVRPVEVLAIVLLVALAFMAGLFIWDATSSLG